MKQKTSYPVQRGSPRMRKNTGDLPLTGQGRIASGGTYSCYGYPNMENIKRATQEFLDGLERDGTLEPALERLRTAKEEKSHLLEQMTQKEI